LDILVQDHEEILIFIDDFLSLNQAGVEDKFCDAFINECLSPLAIALDSQLKEGFSIKIILFVLGMLLKNLNSQLILDTIALMIFGKYYTTDLMNCMFSPVDRLMSYDKKWKFKGFWDSHEDKITNYCM
jgi:type IV secretory pathway VirB6-like protein